MFSTFAWHYYEKQKSSSCILKKKKPYNFSLIQIRTFWVKLQKQDLKRVQRDQKKVGGSQGDAMQIDSAVSLKLIIVSASVSRDYERSQCAIYNYLCWWFSLKQLQKLPRMFPLCWDNFWWNLDLGCCFL